MKSDLVTTLLERKVWLTSISRVRRATSTKLSPSASNTIEFPEVVILHVVVTWATEHKKLWFRKEAGCKGRSWFRLLSRLYLNKLPRKGLILLNKSVNVIHLCAILEPSNYVHGFHTRLFSLECDHAKIISWSWKSLSLDFFLLSSRYVPKREVLQVNYIDSITCI